MFYKDLSADLVTLFSQLAVFAFRRQIIRQTRKWIMSKYSMEETQWKKDSILCLSAVGYGNDTATRRQRHLPS
ncbi:MAG: hypothetical protein ACI4UO_00965 [Paludibacteraceae bacterium]